MTHPIIDALAAWIDATDAYSECDRGVDSAPLRVARDALATAIETHAGAAPQAPAVVATMLEVSSRFISDEYSDDDTDAPCDVEWDVHNLVHVIDPSHVVPEDVRPASVVDHVFPHAWDEE